MRNNALLWVLLAFLVGCTSNGGYHGESLQKIQSRHAEMVQGYKYGSVAQGYYDPALAKEAQGDVKGGGDQFLLAIGIDQYKNLPNFEGASHEARIVAMTLKNVYGFKVKVLDNPTRNELRITVERYRNMLSENSRLIVYFAGRSLLDESSGQGYWLFRDADIDNKDGWLSMEDITSFFRGAPAQEIMVIADSCNLTASNVQLGKPALANGTDESATSQKSRVVLTSGISGPDCAETDSERDAFLEILLETLKNNKRPIEGSALYAAVKDGMARRCMSSPWYGVIPDSGHQGGDVVFVPLSVREALD